MEMRTAQLCRSVVLRYLVCFVKAFYLAACLKSSALCPAACITQASAADGGQAPGPRRGVGRALALTSRPFGLRAQLDQEVEGQKSNF